MSRYLWLLLLIACREDAAPPAPPTVASSPVQWVPARSTAQHMLLEAPARVVEAAHGRASVTAPLRARIVRVLVQPGATVAAAAPLVEVAMPEAGAAAATYLAANEQLAAYEKRATELVALRAEGLVRASDVSSVQLEVARLRGERDVAATTLRGANLALGDARALASSGGHTLLRAPIAGTVLAVSAIVGAGRASEDVLVELAAGPATRVEARLARPLLEGARVEFIPVGGGPVATTLVATAGVREADGSTRAWFELAAPLAGGTTGRIRVATEVQAAAVPAAAVMHAADGASVWKSEAGAPRRTPVRVLATSGSDAIVEGIAPGDSIASVAERVTP